uniref:Uncharacterized protein n=1 Tax=Arundo donax TaxID=35708 RepID=A0A0A9BMU6_ARUDO
MRAEKCGIVKGVEPEIFSCKGWSEAQICPISQSHCSFHLLNFDRPNWCTMQSLLAKVI